MSEIISGDNTPSGGSQAAPATATSSVAGMGYRFTSNAGVDYSDLIGLDGQLLDSSRANLNGVTDPSASPTEQNTGTDQPASEQEGQPETPTVPDPSEAGSDEQRSVEQKHPTTRRVEKLLAKQKESEAKSRQLEFELQRVSEAYRLLESQFNAQRDRLAQVDSVDPLAVENERLKVEKTWRETEQKLQKDYQQKVREAEKQAKIQTLADMYVENIEAAMESVQQKYPHFSKAEVQSILRDNPGIVSEKNIAGAMLAQAQKYHDTKYQAFERDFLQKYKDRLAPPAPVKTTGTVATAGSGDSRAEMLAMLEAEFGLKP